MAVQEKGSSCLDLDTSSRLANLQFPKEEASPETHPSSMDAIARLAPCEPMRCLEKHVPERAPSRLFQAAASPLRSYLSQEMQSLFTRNRVETDRNVLRFRAVSSNWTTAQAPEIRMVGCTDLSATIDSVVEGYFTAVLDRMRPPWQESAKHSSHAWE